MNFIRVTPFMHVPDIEEAIAFFVDILGFEVLFRLPDYAYVSRENVAFRLLKNFGEDGAPPGNRRFAYYIDVADVEAVYAELAPALAKLPPDFQHGPATKPYGQRELCIVAPDGNLIVYGQSV